jgi:hypothetical protein
MIIGKYTLHLYCDQDNPQHALDEFPHEIVGNTASQTRKYARKRGWKLDLENGHAICPKCRKPTPPTNQK